jgi:hypothetical protein
MSAADDLVLLERFAPERQTVRVPVDIIDEYERHGWRVAKVDGSR